MLVRFALSATLSLKLGLIMDLNKLDVFRLTNSKMGWLSERQTVLAQNIANADTPGYKAKDLKGLIFQVW